MKFHGGFHDEKNPNAYSRTCCFFAKQSIQDVTNHDRRKNMAENKKSVDEVLKGIVIEAVNEYRARTGNPLLPKDNTQTNITKKTGIPAATLSRYLDPSANSYPNLVETMEILAVTGKRESLLKFSEQSNCQAAKFIKAYYGTFLELNPVAVTEELSTPNNEEVLRITTESNQIMEKKIRTEHTRLIWVILVFLVSTFYITVKYLLDIKELLLEILKK